MKFDSMGSLAWSSRIDRFSRDIAIAVARVLDSRPALVLTVDMNPGDLSVNSAYRAGRDRRGVTRVRKSKRYAAAQSLVGETALLELLERGLDPLRGAVRVRVRCYWADAGSTGLGLGDVDNPIKGILDALQAAGVFADDAQVIGVEVEKHVDPERPRVEVDVFSH